MGEFAHRPKPKGVAEAPTKKAAPTSNPRRREPPDRRPASERIAEHSDNATYAAMNSKLKLLAYELHAAGRQLRFAIAIANPARIADTESRVGQISSRLGDMADETATQLKELRTPKSEPRLTDGALALNAALDDFDSVVVELDAWMTEHKKEPLSLTVVRRGRELVALVFPSIIPAARPLTPMEKSPGVVREASINAHLDAAIVAAESMTGPVLYADRVVIHAKELAELLQGHPRIEGQLERRIKKLVVLVDQIVFNNPYLKRSFNEAIDPIRNVK